MRLSKMEINIFKETAKQIFGNDVKVFLFGSRTNDLLKGGDIDIYMKKLRNIISVLEDSESIFDVPNTKKIQGCGSFYRIKIA